MTLRNRVWQTQNTKWRNTLAGCPVVVHELLNGISAFATVRMK